MRKQPITTTVCAVLIGVLLTMFAISQLHGQGREHINVGSASNDGTGDSIRSAFIKSNTNFYHLFNAAITNAAAGGAATNAVKRYSTMALMLADTSTTTATIAQTLGFYAPNDGGAAMYVLTNTITSTNVVSRIAATGVSGYSWDLIANELTPEMAGCKGDNSTDDTTRFQAAATAAGGKTLRLRTGSTYKLTTKLDFAANTQVIGSGATVNYTATGLVKGHQLADGVTINGGTWNTLNGDTIADEIFYGELRTVFDSGDYATGTGNNRWAIRNVTISTAHNNANAIWITGDSSGWLVENVTVGDTTTMGRVVICHWGGASTAPPSVTTGHPHSGTIRGLNVGAMSYNADTTPVLLSGCYSITVQDVSSKQARYGAVAYAGDWFFEYASTEDRKRALQGLKFQNITCAYAMTDGIFINGASTKTQTMPIVGGEFKAYVPDFPILIENCGARGVGDSSLGGTSKSGVKIHNARGVRIVNGNFSAFQHGASFGTNVSAITFIGGQYHSNRVNGIHVQDAVSGTTRPTEITISDAEFFLNGWGSSSSDAAGVYVNNADRVQIDRNLFGHAIAASELYQEVGVRVQTLATGVSGHGNYVRSVESGGANIGFSLSNSTTYGITSAWEDNQVASGITRYTGANVQPFLFPGRVGQTSDMRWFRTSLTAAPTTGTWAYGDVVFFQHGFNSPWGAVCLAGGTPGTWAYFGSDDSMGTMGDGDETLTVGSDERTQVLTAALSANRAITLDTSGALTGSLFYLARTAASTGDFGLQIGTGPLITLGTAQWCIVGYDGSAWFVVASGDIGGRYQTLYVDAGAMVSRTTTGALAATTETSTNDRMVDHFLFDPTSDEFVQFKLVMPYDWDGGTIKARFHWDAATSGSGVVVWGLQAGAIADTEAIDAAFGTAQVISDTVDAVGDVHVTSATPAITVGGTLNAGAVVWFQVYRDPDHASDSCAVDAKLLGVTLQFKRRDRSMAAF